jgi:hypothetical protein
MFFIINFRWAIINIAFFHQNSCHPKLTHIKRLEYLIFPIFWYYLACLELIAHISFFCKYLLKKLKIPSL